MTGGLPGVSTFQHKASSREFVDSKRYGRLSRVDPCDNACDSYSFISASDVERATASLCCSCESGSDVKRATCCSCERGTSYVGLCACAGFASCVFLAAGGLTLAYLAPWLWTCDGAPGLNACSSSENNGFTLGCNSWYDPQAPSRQCLNRCGLRVGEDTGADAPAFNGSELFLSNSSACTSLSQGSLDEAAECAEFCVGALGGSFFSPSCWSFYDLPYVCLQAEVASLARKFPDWSYNFGAILYTAISVVVAFLQDGAIEKAPKWLWDTKEHRLFWPLPFPRCSQETRALFVLHRLCMFMLMDRFADVSALGKYLRDGEIVYILGAALTLCIGIDPLQTKALVEYRRSVARGNVGTRGLAEAKAHEATFEGAWGVLTPAAAILSSRNTGLIDLISLLFAFVTSLVSVYDGVGGAREIAGAMTKQAQMPYDGQVRIESSQVKILRIAEVCSLIPVVVCILNWGMLPAYMLGSCITAAYHCRWMLQEMRGQPLRASYLWLPPVLHLPGDELMSMDSTSLVKMQPEQVAAQFPFQDMNPKAFGAASVLLGTCLWPLTPLWPGSFSDTAGECATRPWYAQVVLPAMPPRVYYRCRQTLSFSCLVCLIVPVLAHSVQYLFYLREQLPLESLQFASWHSGLFFVQLSVLAIGFMAPVGMCYVLRRRPDLLNVKESDAAVIERGTTMLWLNERWQHLGHSEPALRDYNIAVIRVIVGCAQIRLRKSEEARENLQQAVKTFESMVERQDRSEKKRFETQLALALVYLARTCHQEGKALSKLGPEKGVEKGSLERAVRLIKEHLGHRHIDHARALEELGNEFRLTSEEGKALELYKEALVLRESLCPFFTNDVETACLKVSKARVFIRQKCFDEGIPELKEACNMLHRTFGVGQPIVGWAYRALGTAYLKNEEWELCAKAFETALPILTEGYGPHHSEVESAISGLGEAYLNLDRPVEAIVHLRHALEIGSPRADLVKQNLQKAADKLEGSGMALLDTCLEGGLFQEASRATSRCGDSSRPASPRGS